MRTVSLQGVRFVAAWEGFRSCPYQDSVGVWTIGFGTTSATGHRVGPGSSCIDSEKARRWLSETLNARCVPAIPKRWLMRQQEIDALASFAYNLGVGAVSDPNFSTLARRLRSARAVSFRYRKQVYREELPKWVYGNGIKLSGLAARRAAEVRVAVAGDYSRRP